MHRQSLGSPVSKLHTHGGGAKEEKLIGEDEKRKDGGAASSLPDDEHENKPEKPHRPGTPPRPDQLIHLIPILTILCFLILYLCSHDPSQKDLAHFNASKRLSKPIDSTEISDFGRFLELDKGDVLAIRSLRNLQEIDKHAPKSRFHRKIGDF